MNKSQAKAKRKAHEQKKAMQAAKEGKKIAAIIIGIAIVALILLYFLFRMGMGG